MTAKKSGPDLIKIGKLLGLLLQHHEQDTAIFAEINELLAGGAGIGAKLKDFQAHFDGAWGQRYAKGETGRYQWNFKIDTVHMKRLIGSLGLEELKRRASLFIRDSDEFLCRPSNRHRFGLFVHNINGYAKPNETEDFSLEDEDGVPGCTHTPRCTRDDIHTAKKNADMRA